MKPLIVILNRLLITIKVSLQQEVFGVSIFLNKKQSDPVQLENKSLRGTNYIVFIKYNYVLFIKVFCCCSDTHSSSLII